MFKDRQLWSMQLIKRIGIIDAIAILIAMLIAQIGRFGTSAKPELETGSVAPSYWTVTIIIAVLWWIILTSWGSRDIRLLGSGTEEYKRVVLSTLYFFGAVAIISYAFQLSTARGYVGIALPLGLFFLLVGRWILRHWLIRRRRLGDFTRRVMLIGSPSAVEHLYERFRMATGAGYDVTVAVLPGYEVNSPSGQELPIPVISVRKDVNGILKSIEKHDVDVIAISAGSQLKPRTIQELGWELADRRISMIMAPALTDVAGPRIHTQPISGLPLIHVSTPKLVGWQALVKRSFDVIGSLAGLTILGPLFVIVGIIVKLDSPGPAFFHQNRVGYQGNHFKMHKFRSMVVDAEKRLADLKNASEGNEVLFKMKSDPRITKVGAFIRRYSIDEIPQLWNVLVGEMSMVGPRPPLASEVEQYERYVSRRLLVKPGITGLWQVSGRSDLSWNESVRLDLYYVENWSLLQDLIILMRTLKAVFGKSGAY